MQRFGTLILRLTGIFAVVVPVAVVVSPRQPTIAYARGHVLFWLAVVTVVLVVIARLGWFRRLAHRAGRAPMLGLLIAGVGSVLATGLALSLRYEFGWDARVVAGISRQLSLGQEVTAYQLGYLSRYPNNLPLLALDNLCDAVGRTVGLDYLTVFIVLNGLCLAVTLQATYWLVSMLRSREAAVAAQLLVLFLVGLSPWMTVAYTDVVATPFVVGGTALVVGSTRRSSVAGRAVLVVLAALCLLVAYEIKATPVVSVVAIGVTSILAMSSAIGVGAEARRGGGARGRSGSVPGRHGRRRPRDPTDGRGARRADRQLPRRTGAVVRLHGDHPALGCGSPPLRGLRR